MFFPFSLSSPPLSLSRNSAALRSQQPHVIIARRTLTRPKSVKVKDPAAHCAVHCPLFVKRGRSCDPLGPSPPAAIDSVRSLAVCPAQRPGDAAQSLRAKAAGRHRPFRPLLFSLSLSLKREPLALFLYYVIHLTSRPFVPPARPSLGRSAWRIPRGSSTMSPTRRTRAWT